MRLFFAVELPDDVRAVLSRLRPPTGAPGAADYRWVDAALLHITLLFLGQQPRDALPRLRTAAREAAATSQPGRFYLGAAGSFGPARAARVLWVGLRGDVAPLLRLHDRLARGLRAAGFAGEDRPFAPHITLARGRRSAALEAALRWPPAQPIPPLPIPLQELTLLLSEQDRAGPRYTPLERFRLG